MKKSSLILAVLLWPLLGMGGFILAQEYILPSGPPVRYDIAGYDPRDLMYGHYLHFRFTGDNAPSQEAFNYYVPEKDAARLEQILHDPAHKMTLDVQRQHSGDMHFGILYIDNIPWRDYLLTHPVAPPTLKP